MDGGVIPISPVPDDKLVRKWNWRVPVVLSVLAIAALAIDIPFVRVFEEKQLPASVDRTLKDALEICEGFGHGFGAALIVIAALVLDPSKRRYWPWLWSSSLGVGLVANLMKLTVQRIRPRDFNWDFESVWSTFSKEANQGGAMQSFPSAHTATAVGLALILTALYPRGKWFFAIMAGLVGMQRIASSAHFPSDVFAGATIGWLVGMLCIASLPTDSEEQTGSTRI